MQVKSVILLASILVVSGSFTLAYAVTTGFVSNPSSNSVDWTNAVTGLGGTVTTLDFNAHPLGALQNNFYAPQGVTLAATGAFGNIVFGAGPGQANTGGNIPGEGNNVASNHLFGGNGIKTLTVTFASPVCGAGLFTIDYFSGPSFLEAMNMKAFTGPSGTGASLGSFNSINMNLQPDHLYFMGITDDTNSIGSIVFSYSGASTGDDIAIDDIKFATCADSVVGGELLSIDTAVLLLAGAQSFSWMIPVVLSVLGIGLFAVSRKSE